MKGETQESEQAPARPAPSCLRKLTLRLGALICIFIWVAVVANWGKGETNEFIALPGAAFIMTVAEGILYFVGFGMVAEVILHALVHNGKLPYSTTGWVLWNVFRLLHAVFHGFIYRYYFRDKASDRTGSQD